MRNSFHSYSDTGRQNRVCLFAARIKIDRLQTLRNRLVLLSCIHTSLYRTNLPCEPRCFSLLVILLPVQCSSIARYHSGHTGVSSSSLRCYHLFTNTPHWLISSLRRVRKSRYFNGLCASRCSFMHVCGSLLVDTASLSVSHVWPRTSSSANKYPVYTH